MKDKINASLSVVSLFIVLIIIMSYPLVFKINTCVPGFSSTDESYGVLWNAWFAKLSYLNTVSVQKTDFIAYPFGIVFFIGKPTGTIFFLISYFLSILTNPVLTYNLQIICNFLLNALFTYLLVYYLTKNVLAGFLSGVIFGFAPYIFVRSWQHLGETYLWLMPLFLWSLFSLREDDRLRVKFMLTLSFILATINYNATYYLGVILGVFLSYLIIKNWNANKAYLRKIFFPLLISLIILLPDFFPIFKNILLNRHATPSAYNIYHRPFEDLFTQSAKPLSYLLPSTAHPIFGKFTEQFIGSQLYGESLTEHTLYLGWVPLILAFIAFRRWKARRRLTKSGTVPFGDSPYYREDFYIGFFIFLALVAWLFSQPPWWNIFGFKIYMPSFFMYKILPMFRAYCRFGIVVMLAVAVLAGFGLKFILERFKSQKAKIALACLFSSLVLFEFWNWPPYKVIDVSKVPQVYYWLKTQPANFVIAEYPLDIIGPNELYKLYQTKHEKKIINGTIPGTYAHKIAKTLVKISKPYTAGVLKWMGVKYVLVHKEDYLNTDLIEDREELEKIPKNPGLKFIRSFSPQECPQKDIMCIQKTGPIDVYEVIARPEEPQIKEGVKN